MIYKAHLSQNLANAGSTSYRFPFYLLQSKRGKAKLKSQAHIYLDKLVQTQIQNWDNIHVKVLLW